MGFGSFLKKAAGVATLGLSNNKTFNNVTNGGALNRLTSGKPEQTAEQVKSENITADIQRDISKGTAIGKDLIGDKSLGRLTDGQATQDIIQERRLSALDGLNAAELGAARSQSIASIDSASEGALRRLKSSQASSGVRGATATRQQADVGQQGVQQKADFEQNLLLQNRNAQQQALDSLQRNVEFDLDAQSREKFAQLSTGLGFAQIGSSERAAEAAREAQIKSASFAGQKTGKF